MLLEEGSFSLLTLTSVRSLKQGGVVLLGLSAPARGSPSSERESLRARRFAWHVARERPDPSREPLPARGQLHGDGRQGGKDQHCS